MMILLISCEGIAAILTHLVFYTDAAGFVFVKMPHGKSIPLRVERLDTVKNVKAKIEQKEGIALSNQRILLNGRPLEDNHTLNDYNVVQEDLTLQLELSE